MRSWNVKKYTMAFFELSQTVYSAHKSGDASLGSVNSVKCRGGFKDE